MIKIVAKIKETTIFIADTKYIENIVEIKRHIKRVKRIY